jgi:hypothetical protein
MKCSICGTEKNWLNLIGIDNVCNKCIEKNTIFKEIRFSNDKRLNIVLKKRNIPDFNSLKQFTEEDFENILLTEPNIGKFKPKPNKITKKLDEDEADIPIV